MIHLKRYVFLKIYATHVSIIHFWNLSTFYSVSTDINMSFKICQITFRSWVFLSAEKVDDSRSEIKFVVEKRKKFHFLFPKGSVRLCIVAENSVRRINYKSRHSNFFILETYHVLTSIIQLNFR